MLFFIVNPSARSSRRGNIWKVLRTALEKRGISYCLCETARAGDAAEAARKISESAPGSTIAVVGGDGTVHEVLNGISDLSSVTLGVIPQGSGNDFARGLRIPSDPLPALDTLLRENRIVRCDIGYVEQNGSRERFGVSCGIGFDAAVCHEALSSRIKNVLNQVGLGAMTYTAIAVKQIILAKPAAMRIRTDGGEPRTYPDVFFAAVMNQKYEGGGLMMTPVARPDDGFLDVFVCGGITKQRLVTAMPMTRRGGHTKVPGVHFLRCRSLEIEAEAPEPIHLDGENGGVRSTLRAGFEEKKLKVIAD